MSNFWDELKRRNVFRETLAYLAAAWVLLEVGTLVLDTFDAPDWISQTLVIILAVGLPIWVVISWAYKITLKGFERVSGPDRESADKKSRRNLLTAFVFAAILAVGLVFAFQGIGFKIREDSQYALAIIPPRFIGENNFDWFSSGLASDIRNKISRVKNLSPTAMRSASRYQDSDKLITEIAKELGVAYILDGEVRMNGNLFMIDLQLLNAAGEEIWSDLISVPAGAHYQVSQNVIEKIIESLEVSVTKEEFGFFEREGTQDEKAWENYAKGEKILNSLHGQGDYQKAAEFFRKAIQLDPDFAEAYAGLAFCTVYDTYWESSKKKIPEAVEYARRALELDSTTVLAIAMLGNYYWAVQKDIEKGHEHYQKALDIDPNNAFVLWDYAWRMSIHTWNPNLQLASVYINKAHQLDPLSDKINWMKGRILWQNRDVDGLQNYIEWIESRRDTTWTQVISNLKVDIAVIKNKDERARIPFHLKSLEQDSLNPYKHMAVGVAYHEVNRNDKYLEYMEKAYNMFIDESKLSEDEGFLARYAEALCETGSFDRLEELMQTEEFKNATRFRRLRDLFRFHYYQGNYERALEIATDSMEDGPAAKFHICLALGKMGRKQEAQEIIMSVYNSDAFFPYWMEPRTLSQVYAAMGERDSMYHYMNHPMSIYFHWFAEPNGHAFFDPYRTEPRYREWLRKTYFPQPEDTIVPE